MSAAWEKPLAGVRVLDFAHVLAGPLCTAFLGVLGAEVYKVESWARLDGTRRKRLSDPPPSREEVGSHRAFQIMNHDKLGVSLNLQEPEGQALAGRLAEECDVLVEAWRPGVAARFGLDYESVRALNPRIVMLSLSGSGQYGPEAQYAMYAAIFAALGGLTHITGYPDGVPTEYRGSIDYRTGFEALLAVLAGLHRREQTDEGCYIDLAGREVCANLIGDAFVELQATGREPGREGNVDRVMSPHGVYETAEQDSWVALAIGSDDEWRAFCAAGPLPALAEDARFADGFRRWKHREELDALVRGIAWVRIQAAEPLIARLQAAGVPWGGASGLPLGTLRPAPRRRAPARARRHLGPARRRRRRAGHHPDATLAVRGISRSRSAAPVGRSRVARLWPGALASPSITSVLRPHVQGPPRSELRGVLPPPRQRRHRWPSSRPAGSTARRRGLVGVDGQDHEAR